MEISETQFFYTLTPDTVLQSVEELGFRCTGKLLALNSLENRVFQVEIEVDEDQITSPFDRYKIAKFYRPGRWSREQIEEEHSFLQALLAAEIPVVPPLPFTDGTTLKKTQEGNLFFCVTDKVGGRHTTELPLDQQRTIGRTLARLHNEGMSHPETVRLQLDPQTYGWKHLEYLLNSEHLPKDSKEAYRSVVEPIVKYAESAFTHSTSIRIHGDCHLGNVLWMDETPTLLDFDDMVFGPAVQDIWLINPGRDEESRKRQEALLEGYTELRHFEHSELELIEVLRALRIIHFEAWIAKRWEDPAFQRTFTEFGSPTYWREELAALTEIGEIISKA